MNRRRKGHSKSRRASAENETIEVEVEAFVTITPGIANCWELFD